MMNESNPNSLPPKSCSIERLVTMGKDVKKVLSGTKSATRRNGRYADVGEIMNLDGERFVINKVYTQTLGKVSDAQARQEGYSDLAEYKEAILAIHPGMTWMPDTTVWVHEFKPVHN